MHRFERCIIFPISYSFHTLITVCSVREYYNSSCNNEGGRTSVWYTKALNKEEFKKFVIENYVSTIDEHDMLKISSGEIVNYLCSEKHDFVMIEYFGDTSSIEQNFSFVSNKIYKKFLLHFVISPTTGFLELAETVEKLGKINICSVPEYITHIEIDDTLRKDKFKFRILSPCYTYLDIWTFK